MGGNIIKYNTKQPEIVFLIGLNFRYQALEAYFRGLIFAVGLEHVIIVAYYLDFCGLNFHLGALRNENKTQRNFPLLHGLTTS